MANTLTTEQLNHYNREGYCFPFDAFPPKTAQAYHQKLLDFEQEIGQDPLNVLRIKSHLVVPWLVEMASTPAILDVVEDIIGPDILCWGSSFFQKEAHDPGFVSWHQDSTYYGLEPPDTLTAWIAISEASLEAGCMQFIPGSQNKGIYDHAELKADDNLLSRGQTILGIEQEKAVPVPLKAGQFSFHKEDTVHASDPNRTDDRRIGLSIHYVAPNVRETKFPGASARVMRGRDTEGHWGEDRWPEKDWDPICLEALDRIWAMYQTPPEVREEVA